MEIYTERLILRPIGISELESTHAYAGDREHTKYMVYLPKETLQETRSFLEAAQREWEKDPPGFYEFAIWRGEEHIGGVSLELNETRAEGELGWILRADCSGKGYGTEAALAMRELARTLGVKKLVAHCDSRNRNSYRIMEKIGMTLEREDGVRRDKITGQMVPEKMYSLLLESV